MSKKILSNAAGAAAIAFMLLCTVFPLVYAVCKSLGGWQELLLWSPGFTRAYFNTFLSAAAVTVLNIVIAVPSAYFFRVSKAKFKNIIYALYIVLLLLPYQATMLPEYMLAQRMGTYDTLWSVIIPSAFAPLSVIILAQMFRAVPEEVLEAYRLESSSLFGEIVYMAIPNAGNGIVCCAVLTFAGAWNMLERPMNLINKEGYMLMQQYISTMKAPEMFAATAVSALPLLLLFVFAEEGLRGLIVEDVKRI